MRHRHKKNLKFRTGVQKRSMVVRSLLTSLVKYGAIKTTARKSKILKAEADSLFSRLVRLMNNEDQSAGKREAIRVVKSLIFGENEGKKLINELLPTLIASGKTSGFVANYKMGPRVGDAAEAVLVKIVA